MKIIKTFNNFLNECRLKESQRLLESSANDLRFKFVLSKDFSTVGIVDRVNGDVLMVEINSDGDVKEFGADEVYILTDEQAEKMMQNDFSEMSKEEIEKFAKENIKGALLSVKEFK